MSGRSVHRGTWIELRSGLRWEASVTMPGSAHADLVPPCFNLAAGVEGAMVGVRALMDPRITATAAIMLRRVTATAPSS